MGETLIFGPISVKFRSINSIQFPLPPCKLLNNSTFYHLKSLIALPIQMIRPANPYDSYFGGGGGGGGGCHTSPYPPQVSPLVWFLVFGFWGLVLGVWFLVFGFCGLVFEVWFGLFVQIMLLFHCRKRSLSQSEIRIKDSCRWWWWDMHHHWRGLS
jgi:hypothetical protein